MCTSEKKKTSTSQPSHLSGCQFWTSGWGKLSTAWPRVASSWSGCICCRPAGGVAATHPSASVQCLCQKGDFKPAASVTTSQLRPDPLFQWAANETVAVSLHFAAARPGDQWPETNDPTLLERFGLLTCGKQWSIGPAPCCSADWGGHSRQTAAPCGPSERRTCLSGQDTAGRRPAPEQWTPTVLQRHNRQSLKTK